VDAVQQLLEALPNRTCIFGYMKGPQMDKQAREGSYYSDPGKYSRQVLKEFRTNRRINNGVFRKEIGRRDGRSQRDNIHDTCLRVVRPFWVERFAKFNPRVIQSRIGCKDGTKVGILSNSIRPI
jgi:hypothetical protein